MNAIAVEVKFAKCPQLDDKGDKAKDPGRTRLDENGNIEFMNLMTNEWGQSLYDPVIDL